MRTRNELGDTLIEIIFAIVILGLIVPAVLAAIATNADGSASHRDLVTADHVLRNYAETVKNSVRSTCTAAGGTWSASYTQAGYTVNSLNNQTCPAVTTTSTVTLQVTTPGGVAKTLDVTVRTP